MRLSTLAMALFALGLAVPAVAAQPYKVIVNADNPTTQIDQTTLRDYFLGKATRWRYGPAVKPVDLPESSPVRVAFSEGALGKTVAAVRSQWLTTVFAGRGTPPVQLESDKEVIAVVASTPGAIGYVSASASLGPSVKALTLTN